MNSVSQKTLKAIDLIERVQALDTTKLSYGAMVQDIKMMQVKVRSVEGDLFSMQHDQLLFIESLWKVSKIEQIAYEATQILDDNEIEFFYSYLDSRSNQWYPEFEVDNHPDHVHMVKLEIFKQEEKESPRAN